METVTAATKTEIAVAGTIGVSGAAKRKDPLNMIDTRGGEAAVVEVAAAAVVFIVHQNIKRDSVIANVDKRTHL